MLAGARPLSFQLRRQQLLSACLTPCRSGLGALQALGKGPSASDQRPKAIKSPRTVTAAEGMSNQGTILTTDQTIEQISEHVERRIYVASLYDYNAGRLYGVWIDANQPAEAIWEGVQAKLAASSDPDFSAGRDQARSD